MCGIAHGARESSDPVEVDGLVVMGMTHYQHFLRVCGMKGKVEHIVDNGGDLVVS